MRIALALNASLPGGLRDTLMPAGCVLLLACACTPSARAQTDEIQVYDAAIAPYGEFNLTVHNNYTWGGSGIPEYRGAIVVDRALNGVAEWAYGAAPWFEAGV